MMKYTNLLVWGKTIIFVILMLFISLSISAERKKVGIVFGGGGVNGAVHVGVMRVLQEEGIPMDYIAGTSIGAIVGSFYAMGYSTNEIDSLIHHLDWNFLISDKTSKTEML